MAEHSEQSDCPQAAGGGPGPPLILAVDDNVEALLTLTRELEQRYGADYEVVCQRSPHRALEILGRRIAVCALDDRLESRLVTIA